jgi:hypothetical protein
MAHGITQLLQVILPEMRSDIVHRSHNKLPSQSVTTNLAVNKLQKKLLVKIRRNRTKVVRQQEYLGARLYCM